MCSNDILACHFKHLRRVGTVASQPPIVVTYGMGVDSTAMRIGLHQRGIRPDLILFADTRVTGSTWWRLANPQPEN
ncbi:MAG: hypothetical protein HYV60_21275 [Planctomycetia bacterium]|nr:hypothetical protein [Planctomycetia bacterium]